MEDEFSDIHKLQEFGIGAGELSLRGAHMPTWMHESA